MTRVGNLEETASVFDGSLLARGQEGYEQARLGRIFHSRPPDRYPTAVLLAASEKDLVAGARLAQDNGWQIGIRAGGHSFPVWGVRDDTLLIDLGAFKEITYDEASNVVAATAAVTGAELNAYLSERGRFFPGGNCSAVGIGGFLLQGGMGLNFRGWGFAAEQMVAIELVTADGELVRADERGNADLFWAARGAGPGFPGLIVRYFLRTREIPGSIMSVNQVFPIDKYDDVLTWLRDTHTAIPDTVHLLSSALVPPFPVPGLVAGEPVISIWAVALCDTPELGRAALEHLTGGPLLHFALLDSGAVPTTLDAIAQFADAKHPAGWRYQVDSAWVQGETADLVAAARRLVLERPKNDPGHTFFMFALPRDSADMAMTLQTDLMVGCYMIYEDSTNDERYRSWMLSAMTDLEPFSVGQYWGDSDQQIREVKCLTDDSWARLQQIRQQHDPQGRFVDYLAREEGFRNVNGWELEP